MVFSSTIFLSVFLPTVVLASLIAPARFRNPVLLGASLVFYLWGAGSITVVLGWTIASSFVGAQRVRRDPSRANTVLVVGVVALPLVWFKYAAFFSGGLLPEQTLPVGISFFTFQALSYVIDVSRGSEPLDRPSRYALYIALFPQLVAGPIVRYDQIREQLYSRTITTEGLVAGATRFSLGLAKKVVIADSVGSIADAAFVAGFERPTWAAWVGIVAYTVQIYFDFSGYSDMAIGLGLMLGFTFPENFERPYSSASITEFWRRWHMTLSSWFRDYVYIPLGGNRGGVVASYRNLLIVFLLTALWHGAAFTFLAWGMLHGAWLVLERATGLRDATRFRSARRALTLLVVMVAWVFFRADSVAAATSFLNEMFTWSVAPASPALTASLHGLNVALLALGVASVFLPSSWVTGQRIVALAQRPHTGPAQFALVASLLPLALVFVAAADFSPFLYFRF